MKYENKNAFEKANMFGTGTPNTAYARFFIGDSFLNPLTDPNGGRCASKSVQELFELTVKVCCFSARGIDCHPVSEYITFTIMAVTALPRKD